jgi:hypothetical protein
MIRAKLAAGLLAFTVGAAAIDAPTPAAAAGSVSHPRAQRRVRDRHPGRPLPVLVGAAIAQLRARRSERQ